MRNTTHVAKCQEYPLCEGLENTPTIAAAWLPSAWLPSIHTFLQSTKSSDMSVSPTARFRGLRKGQVWTKESHAGPQCWGRRPPPIKHVVVTGMYGVSVLCFPTMDMQTSSNITPNQSMNPILRETPKDPLHHEVHGVAWTIIWRGLHAHYRKQY
jgi:hypothetical protein